MADFVVTIKLQLEGLGLPTGGSSGAGGAPATGAGASTSSPQNLDDLRRAFASLASDVRAVSSSIRQLEDALKVATQVSTGASAEGIGASSGSPASSTRAGGGAEASRSAAKAKEQEAEASASAASAASKAAEELDNITKAAERVGKTSADAAEAASQQAKAEEDFIEARIRGLQALRGIDPERFAKQLNISDLISKVFRPAALNNAIQDLSARVGSSVQDLFKIDESVTGEARKSAERLKKTLQNIISGAVEAISTGTAGPGIADTVKRQLSGTVKRFQEQEGVGTAVSIDSTAAAQRVAARQLTSGSDVIERELVRLGEAVAQGVPEDDIQRGIDRLKELGVGLRDFLEGQQRLISEPRDRRGRKTGEVIPEAEAIAAEIPSRPLGARLNKVQQDVQQGLERAAREGTDPAEAARRAFSVLGGDMDNFADNLRVLSTVLKQTDRTALGSTEAFENFRESVRLVGGVQRDEGGRLKFSGVQGPESSLLFARAQIDEARQSLAREGPGARTAVDVKTTDAQGNVKKLRVDLRQLGTTLDTVKVKARETSDNMFDRTSVRAALQRVATWGAAASIVFGAVQAFRQAVDIVVQTESSVVALAKVMNESTSDFEAFAREARDTAITISREFGQPLEDVLETMITFGQQGLTLPEVTSLTRASALAANVTTLDQPTAASALTAATQQFGIEIADAEGVVDSFNEVANNAAVTEDDLAEALKKAGLAAQNAGVEFDEFNGIVAAISEQTRQTGKEIGTSLRFIFSRLTTQEAESGLEEIGVSVRDASGNFRGFIPILNDVNLAFQTLTDSQKQQVAISLSGTRRFNTFLALLNNFDRFQESAANSANSAGSALKEQQRVTQTLSFRIQQLKTSLAGLAISFGDAIITPAKIIVDSLTAVTDVMSSIPPSIQGMVAATALGTIAFIKLGDSLVDFLGLADATQGAFGAIGGSVRRSLFEGQTQAQQRGNLGEGAFLGLTATQAGRTAIAGKTVGDFARFGRQGRTLENTFGNLNKVLVTQQGLIVRNTRNFTKFQAVVSGLKVGQVDKFGNVISSTALGVTSLNSGLSRFVAALTRAATAGSRLPIIGRIFGGIEIALTGALGSLGNFITLAGRIGVTVGLIIGAVKAFNALDDIVNRTGQSVKESLEPELAQRDEAIAKINQQRDAVKQLRDEQERLVSQPELTGIEREESIRRGGFQSTELAQERLRESQQEALNQIGFGDPQLIQSADEFGNVVLRGADAFDTLAAAAANAQENLRALTQINIIEAFGEDLRPAEGVKKAVGEFSRGVQTALNAVTFDLIGFEFADDLGKTAGDRFNEALENLRSGLEFPGVRDAQRLGVDLRQLGGEGVFGGENIANRLSELGAEFQQASAELDIVFQGIQEQFATLPANTSQLALQRLRGSGIFEAQARRQGAGGGPQVGSGDVINQLFLQNREALRQFASSIGTTGGETLGQFNENRVLEEVLDLRENVSERVQRLSGGELVLFDEEAVITSTGEAITQALVQVADDGRRQLVFFSEEANKIITEDLPALIERNKITDLDFIDIEAVSRGLREAINFSVLEINRQAVGAGRGALVTRDLDLGATSRSELSGQQRASLRDEGLFADLIDAQRLFNERIETITDPQRLERGEISEQVVDPGTVSQIQKLANEFDELATITKYRVEIEEVGKAFEQSLEEIRRNNIADEIEAQFSGLFGAGRGIIQRSFQQPVRGRELSAQQRVDRLAPEIVSLANQLSQFEKALGQQAVAAEQGIRTVNSLFQDLSAARLPGGIRDPQSLTPLARLQIERTAQQDQTANELSRGQSLQLATAKQHLSATEQTNVLLQNLIDAEREGGLLGTQLATATRVAGQVPGGVDRLARRVEGLEPSQLRQFRTADLETLARELPRETINNLVSVLEERRSQGQAGDLATQLIQNIREEGGTDQPRRSIIDRNVINTVVSASSGAIENTISQALLTAAREGTDVNNIDALGAAVASEFRDAGLSDFADNLQESLEGGNEQVREILRNSVSAITRFDEPQARGPREEDDGREERLRQQTIKEFQVIRETANQVQELQSASREAVSAILLFGDAAQQVALDLETAINQTIDNIVVGRQLAPFRTPQFGQLRGVETSTVEIDARRQLRELSGAEITAIENQDLVRGVNDANVAFNGLVDQLETVRRAEAEVRRDLAAAERAGDSAAIRAANIALGELGSVSGIVEREIRTAQEALQDFGDAFQNIEAVNQLRVDVEGLIRSFERQQATQFDETSIQTALGRTPFSFTRPTFEQFEQGQGGFLTAFERAVESIRFRQRAGEIGPVEAGIERRRAEFEQDEGLIEFAQQRETQRLQNAVQTAQQIQERLFEFSQAGGPGSGAARSLFQQITSELEQAGDIVPTGQRGRSVRDPRTGRQVDVPASQLLQFRGIPSLDSISQEVARISQQVQREQAQQQADLITQPLLTVLDQVPGKLDAIVSAIKDDPAVRGQGQFQDVLGTVAEGLPNISTALETGTLRQEDVRSLVSFSNSLSQLDPEALSAVLDQLQVPTTEGPQALRDALQGLVRDEETGSPAAQAVERILQRAAGDAGGSFAGGLSAGAGLENLATAAGPTAVALNQLNAATLEVLEGFGLLSRLLDNLGTPNLTFGGRNAGANVGGIEGRFASGGRISGPGGPRGDRVPILASDGEFVVNANAVQKLGLPLLEQLNSVGLGGRKSISRGRKFQEGGFVGFESFKAQAEREREEEEKELRKRVFSRIRNTAEEAAVKGVISRKVSRPAGQIEKLTAQEENFFDAIDSVSPVSLQGVKEDVEQEKNKVSLLEKEERQLLEDRGPLAQIKRFSLANTRAFLQETQRDFRNLFGLAESSSTQEGRARIFNESEGVLDTVGDLRARFRSLEGDFKDSRSFIPNEADFALLSKEGLTGSDAVEKLNLQASTGQAAEFGTLLEEFFLLAPETFAGVGTFNQRLGIVRGGFRNILDGVEQLAKNAETATDVGNLGAAGAASEALADFGTELTDNASVLASAQFVSTLAATGEKFTFGAAEGAADITRSAPEAGGRLLRGEVSAGDVARGAGGAALGVGGFAEDTAKKTVAGGKDLVLGFATGDTQRALSGIKDFTEGSIDSASLAAGGVGAVRAVPAIARGGAALGRAALRSPGAIGRFVEEALPATGVGNVERFLGGAGERVGIRSAGRLRGRGERILEGRDLVRIQQQEALAQRTIQQRSQAARAAKDAARSAEAKANARIRTVGEAREALGRARFTNIDEFSRGRVPFGPQPSPLSIDFRRRRLGRAPFTNIDEFVRSAPFGPQPLPSPLEFLGRGSRRSRQGLPRAAEAIELPEVRGRFEIQRFGAPDEVLQGLEGVASGGVRSRIGGGLRGAFAGAVPGGAIGGPFGAGLGFGVGGIGGLFAPGLPGAAARAAGRGIGRAGRAAGRGIGGAARGIAGGATSRLIEAGRGAVEFGRGIRRPVSTRRALEAVSEAERVAAGEFTARSITDRPVGAAGIRLEAGFAREVRRANLISDLETAIGAPGFVSQLAARGTPLRESSIAAFARGGADARVVVRSLREEVRRLRTDPSEFIVQRLGGREAVEQVLADVRRFERGRQPTSAPPAASAAGSIPAGGGRRIINPENIARREAFERIREADPVQQFFDGVLEDLRRQREVRRELPPLEEILAPDVSPIIRRGIEANQNIFVREASKVLEDIGRADTLAPASGRTIAPGGATAGLRPGAIIDVERAQRQGLSQTFIQQRLGTRTAVQDRPGFLPPLEGLALIEFLAERGIAFQDGGLISLEDLLGKLQGSRSTSDILQRASIRRQIERRGVNFGGVPGGSSADLQRRLDRELGATVSNREFISSSPRRNFGLGGTNRDDLQRRLDEALEGFQDGGKISGPGGPRSDRVPILASDGEFVLNANAVNSLGLPLVDFLNRTGTVPKFQDGGLVGGGNISGGGEINLNTDSIRQAVEEGITSALNNTSVNLDVDAATTVLTEAIQTAFTAINLPELEVNTDNLPTLEVDTPESIPLDISALEGLDLGGALGSDVINRIDSLEGSVTSLREDTNEVLDTFETFDPNNVSSDLQSIREEITPLQETVSEIDFRIQNQRGEIINEAFNLINQELSNLNQEVNVEARLDKHIAETGAEFVNVRNSLNEAVALANRAMTQAIRRV